MSGYGGVLGAPRVGVRVVEVDPADSAWKEDAACRNAPDVDVWYPTRGESDLEAKAVCLVCPVRWECLEYALRHNETQGIWGGMSGRERRRIRHEREGNGRRGGGREPLFTAMQRQRIVWLDGQGWTDAEIAAEFGCTARTVQRVLAKERMR